jgi:hypothetical protein
MPNAQFDREQIVTLIQALKPGKKIKFGKVTIVYNRTRGNYTIMLAGAYIEETIDIEDIVNSVIGLNQD